MKDTTASRWCYTVQRSATSEHLGQVSVTGADEVTLKSRSFIDENTFDSLISSSRASRANSQECSKHVRIMTDPGCSVNDSSSYSSTESGGASSSDSSSGGTIDADTSNAPHQKTVALASLPSCAASQDYCASPLCPKSVVAVNYEAYQQHEQLDEQTTEMSEFVARLMKGGVIVKQRLRWGRSRLTSLQLTADMTLTCVAIARRRTSSTILMSQVAEVYRDSRIVTLLASDQRERGVAFKLSRDIDAVLLECLLKSMCNTAVARRRSESTTMRITSSDTCSSSSSSSCCSNYSTQSRLQSVLKYS
jgi:hypothetical protein